MNKNLDIEAQDAAIQAMSIAQLKQFRQRSTRLNIVLEGAQHEAADNATTNMDTYIQQLQLSALRKIVENSQLLSKINEDSLRHKSNITGLDRNIVLLIENSKENATLQQIVTYCTKLNIPFKRLLPELYQ
jgi:hypothetical protein